MLRTLFALALLCVIAPVVAAQAPALATPPAATKPTAPPVLEESDVLVLQVVQLAAVRANEACASLDAAKFAQATQRDAITRFAKKYPTFDVDFAKGALVAKVTK